MSSDRLLAKLSAEEREKLQHFVAVNGRSWKSKLRDCWMRGDWVLRETRNTIGPSGLSRLRVAKWVKL
ncbi:hypothetical protein [Allorhodopirellula heiligendammensis]|uniref:Uncharacterized protein n=1 Tax=Allorhodopirellula heiligendammensis TaxID=2714739 RepID=A0A5C6C5D9_9BACT|nr:hypothetical protein [Allorhodopirellula heiligendammensis]TWU18019.1 hypothetical protein Poly21_01720 [Allorhodopirellula heiligendammensis]